MFEESTSLPLAKPSFVASVAGVHDKRATSPQYTQPDVETERGGPALSSLVDVLDMLEQGVVMVRSDLHPCYHNSAANELLDSDSQRDVLTREVKAVSRIALAGQNNTAIREVGTTAGFYRLRAQLLKRKLIDITSRTVLVTIERAESRLPSREFLMQRFAMTEREAGVALLLARGARNATIASELRISPHTARHHTENVLGKLNVHTRGQVAKAIVTGFPTP